VVAIVKVAPDKIEDARAAIAKGAAASRCEPGIKM
jgi:quinol monooxygenase YgiN